MWKHAAVVLSLTLAGLAFGVSEVQACACVTGPGAPAGLSREEQSEHNRTVYGDHVRKQFAEATWTESERRSMPNAECQRAKGKGQMDTTRPRGLLVGVSTKCGVATESEPSKTRGRNLN